MDSYARLKVLCTGTVCKNQTIIPDFDERPCTVINVYIGPSEELHKTPQSPGFRVIQHQGINYEIPILHSQLMY